LPASSRLHATAAFGPPVDDERLYRVVDVLDEIVEATGKTIPQIALNWVLQRPTVSTVLIGARDEKQLRENLGAIGWQLSAEQMAKLDAVSALTPPYPYYPYWNGPFAERAPPPVRV
jgi:aryl-alcohol dehydrogenase-like predicted oxidoreductase